MKIQQFLEYHGMVRNPFAEEDAQTDPIFKGHCISSTFHPTWDKVYGDPREPSTAVVFGEKGSGKTAIRLQIARHLQRYNHDHADKRVFVIHYEDFNPFLDRFCSKLRGRKRRADRALATWKLWDHMDAILTLGVTDLVDRILSPSNPSDNGTATENPVRSEDVSQLDRHQARDLLLLAACYDHSMATTFKDRWQRLRTRVRYQTWRSQIPLAIGLAWMVAVLGAIVALFATGHETWAQPLWLFVAAAFAGWLPWLWRQTHCWWLARGVLSHLRISNHETGQLRQVLMQFPASELSGQPLPNRDRTDDRYELLVKFQSVLRTLGFSGIIVLVDRLDEPHLINGSIELMKSLLWPMLDNKFLKHPGIGLKLMVPLELTRFLEREDKQFYERARLDKQNLVANFEWSGEALFDVATSRIRACSNGDKPAQLQGLFDPSITERRLVDTFRQLRVPRRLFKFLYRLLVNHCNAHTDQQPAWKISSEMFEATLSVYLRDQDAFDRGLAAG
ncbi:MAG: hypothetical protein AB7O38_00655 [Pirellulaceae bacterium]